LFYTIYMYLELHGINHILYSTDMKHDNGDMF